MPSGLTKPDNWPSPALTPAEPDVSRGADLLDARRRLPLSALSQYGG